MRKLISVLSVSIVMLLSSHIALSQTGGLSNTGNVGNCMLELFADNLMACNPGANGGPSYGGTGSAVKHGTALTVKVVAKGITGGGYNGSTYVANTAWVYCVAYDTTNGSATEIFSVETHSDLNPASFTWTPVTAGNYYLYCSAAYNEYPGEGYGSATAGYITIPVS